MSTEDRELLDALVQWWDVCHRPWKMRAPYCWEELVDAGMAAYAPNGHVYPLPRGVNFAHRSAARRKSAA